MHRGRLLFCNTPERLKEQMPGAVVAVVSPVASKLREELAHADGVSSGLLIGDSVHLFVDDAARRIPELTRALDASGLPYHEVVRITPTIEDLFVNAVTGQSAESDGGLRESNADREK